MVRTYTKVRVELNLDCLNDLCTVLGIDRAFVSEILIRDRSTASDRGEAAKRDAEPRQWARRKRGQAMNRETQDALARAFALNRREFVTAVTAGVGAIYAEAAAQALRDPNTLDLAARASRDPFLFTLAAYREAEESLRDRVVLLLGYYLCLAPDRLWRHFRGEPFQRLRSIAATDRTAEGAKACALLLPVADALAHHGLFDPRARAELRLEALRMAVGRLGNPVDMGSRRLGELIIPTGRWQFPQACQEFPGAVGDESYCVHLPQRLAGVLYAKVAWDLVCADTPPHEAAGHCDTGIVLLDAKWEGLIGRGANDAIRLANRVSAESVVYAQKGWMGCVRHKHMCFQKIDTATNELGKFEGKDSVLDPKLLRWKTHQLMSKGLLLYSDNGPTGRVEEHLRAAVSGDWYRLPENKNSMIYSDAMWAKCLLDPRLAEIVAVCLPFVRQS